MGLKTFCQEQNSRSENAQVVCVGGGCHESGEWQMAPVTRHISLKLLEQSRSSQPENYISSSSFPGLAKYVSTPFYVRGY